jgi:hypothetical protein
MQYNARQRKQRRGREQAAFPLESDESEENPEKRRGYSTAQDWGGTKRNAKETRLREIMLNNKQDKKPAEKEKEGTTTTTGSHHRNEERIGLRQTGGVGRRDDELEEGLGDGHSRGRRL